MNNILILENICKTFTQANNKLKIFENANLEVKQGEIVALVGNSGCGKSTLLQIAGLLDNVDSGKVKINEIEIDYSKHKIDDKVKTEIRKNNIGFIYQFHNLLNEFTAIENVMIPELIKKKSRSLSKDKAFAILDKLGLGERVSHYPTELSGGEQQRVAIARAVIGNPALILADEPTGNLDPKSAKIVMDYFIKLVKDFNLSALIVTHNNEIAKSANNIVTIEENIIKNL